MQKIANPGQMGWPSRGGHQIAVDARVVKQFCSQNLLAAARLHFRLHRQTCTARPSVKRFYRGGKVIRKRVIMTSRDEPEEILIRPKHVQKHGQNPIKKRGLRHRTANPHFNTVRVHDYKSLKPCPLLDFIASQVFIALGKLGELRLVVDIRFRNLKTTNPLGNVSLDINDTINFTEITSYRGGTPPSEHVGNFKGDQSNTRLRRFTRPEAFRIGRRLTTNPGCSKSRNKQHRYKLFHQDHLSSQLTLHSSWL